MPEHPPSPRPPLAPVARFALVVGAASGAVEVGLRAAPRLGLTAAEVWAWLGVAMGLGAGLALAAAVAGWAARRWAHGAVAGALLLVHVGLWYRFEVVLNDFLRAPRVWGGLLLVAAAAVGVAVALEQPLARRRAALHRVALVVAAGGALVGFLRSRPAAPAPADGRPNVVLFTLDTARADRFGAYGAENATPFVNRLAGEGTLFTQAVATAPLTEPSHLAILAGDPPHATGVVSNGTDIGDRPGLLARALGARGWRTGGFVAGFPLHGKYGWDQGFDVYDDDFGAMPGLHRLSLVKAWDQVALPAHALRERRGDAVLARALPWLDAQAEGPFFLWVHLFDAHGPYEAPGQPFHPPTDGAPLDLPGYWPPAHRAITSTDWLVSAYEAEIRYVDQLVGAVLERLDERGLADRTLVVLTADHGESLTEHGTLFDHGDDLFDPSLKVPLIVRWPGQVAARRRVHCQASNLDVAPTVLGLLGVDDGIARQGRDRSALLRGGDCADEPVVATTVGARFVDEPPLLHALRAGGLKLVWDGVRDQKPVSEALYDLVADPGERAPVDDPARAAALRAALAAALAAGTAPTPGGQDAETVEALRALGYMEE